MTKPEPIDRRQLIVWAAAASISATGLFIGATALTVLQPPRRSVDGSSDPGAIAVCRSSDLSPGRPLLVDYGDRRLYVVRVARSEVTAFDAACPHAGCSLGYDARTSRFVCPCHGSAFALDGRRLAGPARRGLVRARTRTVADEVVVEGFDE